MLQWIKRLFGGNTVSYKGLVENGAIIIDVRTPAEFKSGHIAQAVNIPLDNIKNLREEIRRQNKIVITCCRSGARSALARQILESDGIVCYNGGSWVSLREKIK